MSYPSSPVPPAFINMTVQAEPRRDKTGNTPCGGYHVTCHPAALVVSQLNSILNFQLIAPTPDGVKFASISKHKPIPVTQLSNPSISLDGKLMTLCDANTVAEPIDVTFHFTDGPHTFTFDPQVQNEPK